MQELHNVCPRSCGSSQATLCVTDQNLRERMMETLRKTTPLLGLAALVVLTMARPAVAMPLVIGARIITLDAGLECSRVDVTGRWPYATAVLRSFGDLRLPELIAGTRFYRGLGVAVAGALGSALEAPTIGSDMPSLGLYLFHATPLDLHSFDRVVYGRIRGWRRTHGTESLDWCQASLGLSLSRLVFDIGIEGSYNHAILRLDELTGQFDGWQVGVRLGLGGWHEFRF